MRMYGLDLIGRMWRATLVYCLRTKSQRLGKWREVIKMAQCMSGLVDADRTQDLPYFENETATSDFRGRV